MDNCLTECWVTNVVAILFREEEEGPRKFLRRPASFAESRNIDRSADGEAIVVIAERSPFQFAIRVSAEYGCERRGSVGLKIVGIKTFIPHKFETAAVKLVSVAASHYVYFS